MKDYYSILGVPRTAAQDEIKRAYRKLASQHHPDKGGDTAKFQEIEEAYRVLSDPDQRGAYDNPRPNTGGFNFHNQPFDFDTIFNMFGARPNMQQRPASARMNLWIQLVDVATGGMRTVTVGTPQGQQIVEIEVPRGVEDGQSFNYPGLAPGGMDLVVTFRIHPNPRWHREGLTVYVEHPVDVWTMITGGETMVRDLQNKELAVGIPEKCQPGTILRCRGRGIQDNKGQTGDLMVRVQAKIPDTISPELLSQIRAETSR